jgi:hypothetical protein
MKIQAARILSLFLLLAAILLGAGCPENEDDRIMLSIYQKFNKEIALAVLGTDVSGPYLAALISLESHPPGNASSSRFEQGIYDRLLLAKAGQPYGSINARTLARYGDQELRDLSTSYGLTQIMGFHCLNLGCDIKDLKSKYHLQWAVAWMQRSYGRHAAKKDWEACFRIHNTGRPSGKTTRADYVERGLARMQYYRRWIETGGDPLKQFFERTAGK